MGLIYVKALKLFHPGRKKKKFQCLNLCAFTAPSRRLYGSVLLGQVHKWTELNIHEHIYTFQKLFKLLPQQNQYSAQILITFNIFLKSLKPSHLLYHRHIQFFIVNNSQHEIYSIIFINKFVKQKISFNVLSIYQHSAVERL